LAVKDKVRKGEKSTKMKTAMTKRINEAVVNDVLAGDIYSNGRLIISKDTLLTERLITLLKNRSIKSIYTTVNKMEENGVGEELEEEKSEYREKWYESNNSFFEILELVGSESRYGNILSSSEDVEFIMNLFTKIHNKYDFIDELYKLKAWDHYTFVHSFDVFILGSLFARQKGVQDLESVALGYLLHDIGKLQIPQEILTLGRKLSYKEFAIMKTHTNIGSTMLKLAGLDHIAQYAKSHHERIDGSGYPEQLKGNDLRREMKIVQIVDVYSALTLNRPYRDALSASKALDLLFRDAHQYDLELLKDFIELLKIYPSNSTVLLSDHTHAKIVQANELLPMFPIVKRSNDFTDFHLPYDFKIIIDKMIEHQPKSFQDRFKEFSQRLIAGYEGLLQKGFSDLSDGLKIEEVYSRIIMPLYRVITILYEGKIIDSVEYNLRISSIMRLLQLSEDSILENNHYRTQTLLVIEGNEQPLVHMKILQGLLHIENIYPIVIKNPISVKFIEKTVADFNIESVFIFNSTGKFNLNEPIHLSDVTYRSIAYKELEKMIDSTGALFSQSNQIYKWLIAQRMLKKS